MNAQKYSQLAWPGVLALLTGMYVYWAAQNQLVSSRPSLPGKHDVPDPIPPPGVHTLHSRIWDDPLSSAYENWKELPEGQREKTLRSVLDGEGLTRALETVRGGQPSEWFNEAGTSCPGPAQSRRDMRSRYAELAKHPTHCLAVFLPGEPYAEDKERRMRTRYAVETALTEGGYQLEYSRRISYLVPKVFVRAPGGWQEREIVVPIKLYKPDPENKSDRPQVMVLWINETELGQLPLLATHRILNAIFCRVNPKDRENFEISIIGPSTSDMLQAMTREYDDVLNNAQARLHWKLGEYGETAFRFQDGFSPLGKQDTTVEDDDIVPIFSPRATAELDQGAFAKGRFRLYRVIGTDQELAVELRDELKLRGALSGKVALITENDSRYGQKFRDVFKDKIRDLLTFGMLRGIDGKLPGDDGEAKSPTPSPKADQAGLGAPATVDRRPEGRSQYDYLRRLGQQIKYQAKSDRVSAIGVVGTDVYDKLLVLRALRPQFPDAVFFTTDMDAIYADSSELPHTRGLVIASHFGLSLNEKLQCETSTFRDSYQTSTFLATRLAVSKHVESLSKRENEDFKSLARTRADDSSKLFTRWLTEYEKQSKNPVPVVRYLIGRNGAQQLATSSKPTFAEFHPDRQVRVEGGQVLLAIFVALIMAGCGLGLAHTGVELQHSWKPYLKLVRTPPDIVAQLSRWLAIGGIILLAVVLAVGIRDPVMAAPLNANSTWAGNLLYAIAGIVATCSIVYVYLALPVQVTEALDDDEESKCAAKAKELMERAGDESPAGENAPARYCRQQLLPRGLIVGAIAIATSTLLIFGFAWGLAWLGAGWAFVVVAGQLDKQGRTEEQWRSLLIRNPVFANAFEGPIAWGLGAVLAVAVVVLLFSLLVVAPEPGWAPVLLSRGTDAQVIDVTVAVYAFLAVGLLYGIVLYMQIWCLAFMGQLRSALKEVTGADSTIGLDRLRLAGGLTSMPTKLVPSVMAILLLLVLGYHPLISPIPMPMGVLVVISLAISVLAATVLWTRRHFQLEREQVLSELRNEIARMQVRGFSGGDSPTPTPTPPSRPGGGDGGTVAGVPVLSGE